jgi:hypothetical protein
VVPLLPSKFKNTGDLKMLEEDQATAGQVDIPSPGRLRAMAKQCRNKGGSCDCDPYGCKVLGLANMAVMRAERTLKEAQAFATWVARKPCTVSPDWVRPNQPDGDYYLAVFNDLGEWVPHWASDTEKDSCIDIVGSECWPFIEETACAEDWEKLGFTVV